MQKVVASLGGILFVLVFAVSAVAQAVQEPRGTATDVSNADLQAAVQKMTAPVGDVQLRVVAIGNQPNVGVGIVRRTRPGGANSIEHSQITEIYHITEGSATLVTGGTMESPREAAADSQVVKLLNGPSTTGGTITGGVSRQVGVGDVVIIPPNTPHWFSAIASERIVYLVVRVDPHKVLPTGHVVK